MSRSPESGWTNSCVIVIVQEARQPSHFGMQRQPPRLVSSRRGNHMQTNDSLVACHGFFHVGDKPCMLGLRLCFEPLGARFTWFV